MQPSVAERLVDVYPYRAANGALICEVRRFSPKRFEVCDDQGTVLPQLPPDVPLYRLPELLQADPSETVFVVEGEKDADNLRQRGLVATTNPGGTHRGWRDEFGECLRGRHVVVLPDADRPGKRHAAAVAEALQGNAASVVVLELPGLHGADDVSDWLQSGKSVLRLPELVARARFARAGLARPPKGAQKTAVIWGAQIGPTSKLVLMAVYHQSRHDGAEKVDVAETPAPELARLTELHRVTVQRSITDLRRRGVLLRRPAGRGHVIAWDVLAALAPQR
jgi:hypothetical protein